MIKFWIYKLNSIKNNILRVYYQNLKNRKFLPRSVVDIHDFGFKPMSSLSKGLMIIKFISKKNLIIDCTYVDNNICIYNATNKVCQLR